MLEIVSKSNSSRLLILNRDQFGHHTVTYKFAIGLSSQFDVSYLCWDYGKPRVETDQLRVVYVSRDGNRFSRYVRFLRCAISESKNRSYDLVFFKYFPGASIVKLLGRAKVWVFDIRTGPVSGSKLRRAFVRSLMLFEAHFFKDISVISSSLSQDLGLDRRNVHILPLGSDIISASNKDWGDLRLLYVGTLAERNIHLTIVGLAQFIAACPRHDISRYTIIGSGPNGEEEYLRGLVIELGLGGIVDIIGRVAHNDLSPYFDSHNVGIAFVPITPYFDCQPPTKVYEYLLSGLAVLATNTKEMKNILEHTSAIMCDDTADSFCCALRDLESQRGLLISESLRESAVENTWSNIIKFNLVPYINRLL